MVVVVSTSWPEFWVPGIVTAGSRGSGCCTAAVEHTPEELQGAGLFYFSSRAYSINGASLIQVPHIGATLLFFRKYMHELESKQSQYARIEQKNCWQPILLFLP